MSASMNRYVVGAITLLAAWFLFSGIWVGILAYSATPFYDQWSWLRPSELLSGFFAQHNEHRIVIPRLIFILDAYLTGASGLLGLALVYVLGAIHAALLFVVLGKAYDFQSGLQRALLATIGVAFFFTGFQFENFISGFQTCFVGIFTFGTLSFALLSRYSEAKKFVHLLWAVVASLVAAGCLANGVFVGALLVLQAWLLRLRIGVVMGLAGLSALTIAGYMQGYHSPGGHGSIVDRLKNLPALVEFALAFVGGAIPNSVSALLGLADGRVSIAAAFGLVGAVAALLCIADALKARAKEPWRSAVAMALLLVGITAGLTALGRAGLSADSALANRYGAATASFWVIVFGWSLSRRWQGVRTLGMLSAGAALIVMALAQLHFANLAMEYGFRKREAGLALLSKVNAPELLRGAHPSPDYLMQRATELRKAKLSLFAEPWSRMQGERIALPAKTCVSRFAGAKRIAEGVVEVTVSFEVGAGPRAIAFVDERTQAIVGFGIRNMRNDPARPWPFRKPGSMPMWIGFAAVPTATSVVAVAIDRNGNVLCRQANAILVGG